jgi:hypothetical protein
MGGEDAEPGPESETLEPRPPDEGDLAALCRRLNELGAKYVVVGGFAIIAAEYPRLTGDVDFLVAADRENEARVYKALEILSDKAVLELNPGDVNEYAVVRVADEIVVDLMKSACGIEYEEAAKDVVVREVLGVPIPFASPRLLWRMKKPTRREKDAADVAFLREYFRQQGEEPPAC